jgi:hypothetical protein
MHPGRRLLRHLGLCSLTALIAGCSDGTTAGAEACRQTYEFANFGCARVQGTARNAAGEPLARVALSLRPVSDEGTTYDSPFQETDETGTFSLEIHNYAPSAFDSPVDTVPMYLFAFVIGAEPSSVDTTLLNMIFAAVGDVPEVIETDITIE